VGLLLLGGSRSMPQPSNANAWMRVAGKGRPNVVACQDFLFLREGLEVAV